MSTYAGPLYRVQRLADGVELEVPLLAPGGFVDAAAQDNFCRDTTCVITTLFDQTPNHNDLAVEGAGGNGGPDVGAVATALPVIAGGHRAYGVYFTGGVGYRDNRTKGVARGSAPEGMYMVGSGRAVNRRCCFDFGNAEVSSLDTGNGHMDAVNLSTRVRFTPAYGTGPWAKADLENGLFAGGNGSWPGNTGRPDTDFITAMLANDGMTRYTLKDGSAQAGALMTRYDGPLPELGGYRPMHKEGAIVLGTGGDNSNESVGGFFEGVMTAGYPPSQADDLVQANVVSVGYRTTDVGPVSQTPGSVISVANGDALTASGCHEIVPTRPAVAPPTEGPCQRWELDSARDRSTRLVLSGLDEDLTASNCMSADVRLIVGPQTGTACQRWVIAATGGGSFEVVQQDSGMVLTAGHCGYGGAAGLRLAQATNTACQRWRFRPDTSTVASQR